MLQENLWRLRLDVLAKVVINDIQQGSPSEFHGFAPKIRVVVESPEDYKLLRETRELLGYTNTRINHTGVWCIQHRDGNELASCERVLNIQDAKYAHSMGARLIITASFYHFCALEALKIMQLNELTRTATIS